MTPNTASISAAMGIATPTLTEIEEVDINELLLQLDCDVLVDEQLKNTVAGPQLGSVGLGTGNKVCID